MHKRALCELGEAQPWHGLAKAFPSSVGCPVVLVMKVVMFLDTLEILFKNLEGFSYFTLSSSNGLRKKLFLKAQKKSKENRKWYKKSVHLQTSQPQLLYLSSYALVWLTEEEGRRGAVVDETAGSYYIFHGWQHISDIACSLNAHALGPDFLLNNLPHKCT